MADAATTSTDTNTEVNFEDAFARLAALEDAPAATKPVEEPPKSEPAPAAAPAEAASEGQPAAEAPPAEEPPAEEPKAEEKPLEAAKPQAEDADEVLARLARLVKDTTPEPQPEPQPPQQQEEPFYSKEEQEFLTNYEKDWPDVAKAESLRRRAEYRELVSYVFQEVAKNLQPIVETVQVMSHRTHLTDLKSTVEDYDTVRDKVVEWVDQQPAYLQTAYKHVIQNGTVDEIADLIGRYKRETGSAAPSGNAAPAPRKVETELPSATKQAAAALAPVSSKRSAVTQGSDPSDFESAFAAFASKL